MTRMTNDTKIDRILEVLIGRNAVARSLGVQIESAEAGRVTIAMPVREDMVNSAGTCHGGYIFLLGDQTAGWTCMTGNEQAVTTSAHVTYTGPAKQGDVLVAEGQELTRTRRSGTYDVRIATREGRLVALVRCQFAIVGPEILTD